MKLQFIIFFLTYLSCVTCAFDPIGQFVISTVIANGNPVTADTDNYYNAGTNWNPTTATATQAGTLGYTFDYNASTGTTTPTIATAGTAEYLVDFDIFDITGGVTTRSFKKGPFVIFNLPAAAAVGCTAPTLDAIEFNIKFFCNDTDAQAFLTVANAGAFSKLAFMVDSSNAVITPNPLVSPADDIGNVAISYADVVLGKVIVCS